MNTKEKIEVMKAYLGGKEIQYKAIKDCDDCYDTVQNPSWNWDDYQYRVKPEPRYLNVYHGVLAHCKWNTGTRIPPIGDGCIGYLEDKQDGTPIIFHPQ